MPSGIAGGLTNLSKMPACNLMLLGAQRRTLSGFSSTSLLPHTGFIYHCDVVQTLPPVSPFSRSSALVAQIPTHVCPIAVFFSKSKRLRPFLWYGRATHPLSAHVTVVARYRDGIKAGLFPLS